VQDKTRQDKTRQDPETDEFIDLRSRSQAAMQEKAMDHPDVSTLPANEIQAPEHELHVHQLEMEMQNDELKTVQLALETSRNKYQELYDSAPVGYFTLTHKGIIKEVNTTGANLLGMARSKLIGRGLGRFVASESENQWYQHIISVLKQREKLSCFLTLKSEDGLSFYAHLASVRMDEPAELQKENDGRFMIRTALSDITERKRLEAERLEMECKLLDAQKLQGFAAMAGGIAHDFNNVLMVVLGNLELALTDRGLGAEGKKAIENAIQATDRSAELSHQMLIYSGKLFYVPKDLDLCELAYKNEDLLKSIIPKTTTFHFEIHKGHLAIRGDADQIQRLITNLVINASEAIGAITGDVTIMTGVMDCDAAYLSNSRLEIPPEPGQFVFLEVTDTGCGMDVATQRKLFDPFFSTKFWGRGLGMAEVMGIVKGHHGAIMVDSEVGKGTTIRVLFSAPKKVQAEPVQVRDILETQTLATDCVGRRKTVLVVEDEELVRGLLIRRLEALGYDTISASDGDEGVHLFRERLNEIDLVLLDFAMPRMNGVEAFEKLVKIRPDVKVILSSGYTEDIALQSFPDRRPAGILHKPYKMEELKGELERLLGNDG
jgi:PAS domain S-box-containing protein